MKQIKFMLLMLTSATYTSLIWATVMFKGINIGDLDIDGGFSIGTILSILSTIVIAIIITIYIKVNWDEK